TSSCFFLLRPPRGNRINTPVDITRFTRPNWINLHRSERNTTPRTFTRIARLHSPPDRLPLRRWQLAWADIPRLPRSLSRPRTPSHVDEAKLNRPHSVSSPYPPCALRTLFRVTDSRPSPLQLVSQKWESPPESWTSYLVSGYTVPASPPLHLAASRRLTDAPLGPRTRPLCRLELPVPSYPNLKIFIGLLQLFEFSQSWAQSREKNDHQQERKKKRNCQFLGSGLASVFSHPPHQHPRLNP
ncbi:hypothetical protein JMJ77_0005024, partial [Colletotrichum scovillei]